MTDLDLDHLEQLEAVATAGPWKADVADPSDVVIWGSVKDEFLANVGCSPMQSVMVAFDADTANAHLIAAARNALPLLVARVRELEGRRCRDCAHGADYPQGVVDMTGDGEPVYAIWCKRSRDTEHPDHYCARFERRDR